MYQPFDEDDWDSIDGQSGPPGAPDPESGGSISLWIHGLLEDPLDDTEDEEMKENIQGQ